MDEYTGSEFGVSGSIGNPLEDHHEHEVPEQRHHEEQLWDQHKEHTADLAKVPGEREGGVETEERGGGGGGCQDETEKKRKETRTQFGPGVNMSPEGTDHKWSAPNSGLNLPRCILRSDHSDTFRTYFNTRREQTN